MTIRFNALAAVAAAAFVSTAAVAAPQFSQVDFAAAAAANASTASGPVTIDGMTFSSTDGYVFGPNAGLYTELGPVVLSDLSGGSAPLTVTFDTAQTSVSFGFALADFLGFGGGDTLTVTDSNNNSTIDTALVLGTDLFPEGYATFTDATPFTSLTFSSAYGITVAPVPEPASMAMLGAALVGVAAVRRRRAA